MDIKRQNEYKFYSPAWKHHGDFPREIQCDICQKHPLKVCWGLPGDSQDFCLTCTDENLCPTREQENYRRFVKSILETKRKVIDIGGQCYQSFPCKHNVTIRNTDGSISEKLELMSAPDILDLVMDIEQYSIRKQDMEHFSTHFSDHKHRIYYSLL